MNYTPEDYVEFYNDRVRTTNARHGWLFVAALLLIVVCTAVLNGCDFQAAQATQESIVVAQEKKEIVMGMPCTWVAQCTRINLSCDVKQRKCTSAADLTERQ